MNYIDILKSCNYPETVIVLDFETYFDNEFSLKNLSNIQYITDPHFEFTGLGYQLLNTPVGDLEPKFIPPNEIDQTIKNLQDKFGLNLEQLTTVGQNFLFDGLILKQKFNIFSPFMVDIVSLSRHQDARMSHKLEDLAKKYKCKFEKGDIKEFEGLHYKNLTTDQKEKLQLYNYKDVTIASELFQILLPKLSNPQIELPLMQHTLKCYLQPTLQLDFGFARELKAKMEKELQQSLNKIEWILEYKDKQHDTVLKIIRSDIIIDILQDELPENEKLPTKMGKKGPIPQLAKQDEGCKYLLEHPNEKIHDLIQARLASKSWGTHIKRLDSLINQAKCQNGKIGMPLWYYGGHTGRWSGTQNINPQNFGGEGRGELLHPLISQVKKTLQAPKDYVLLIVDLAQIEARLLAWLAGQNDLLEDFKNGKDVYSKFASILFNIPIRKPIKTDPLSLYDFLKTKRGFGKDAILGCGYGMGANKFYNRCLSNSDIYPTIKSGQYDYQFIKGLIDNYRKTYPEIPKFWNTIEKAFRWVIKYPHEIITIPKGFNPHRRTNGQIWFTKPENSLLQFQLALWNNHNIVNLQLPSGRILFYPYASINKIGNLLWRWGKLWGGSITENIIQAIARDILAKAILRLENEKFNVVLNIHDSLVCVTSKKDAEQQLKKMIEIMCIPPTWGQDISIAAEGEISKCLN